MFYVGSNYSEQAQGIPAYNGVGPFSQADAATRIRGLSKLGIAGFIIISAARWVNDVDPTLPLTFVVVCGVVWLLSNPWAKKVEIHAQAALVELQGR